MKDIIVFYHGQCVDGFGAAWAAWKKFGDTATYIPTMNRNEYPEGAINREIYVLDYSFNKEVMAEMEKSNKRLVVIDHHISEKTIIESLKEYVFQIDKSGALLAWNYFHPDTSAPLLIQYISDGDIWAHALPNWKEVESYIHSQKLEFEEFNKLDAEIRDDLDKVIHVGRVLENNFSRLVAEHMEKAVLIVFEGYEVYACNSSSFLRSALGHELALKKGPFSIVYRFDNSILHLSLRGDGGIDVAKIAKNYSDGGGHHNAAGIRLRGEDIIAFIKKIDSATNK
jgi:oligoribonuclease NrnB/cAMP/cGMP phosphodiesterase (DHH superfamily)